MQKQKSAITELNPISTIRQSDAYLAVLANANAHEDYLPELPGKERAAVALGKAASLIVNGYKNENNSEFLDTDHLLLRVVELAQPVVEAVRLLDSADVSPISRDTKRSAKTTLVKYNHCLRDIIDNNPHMSRSELIRTVQSIGIEMFDSETLAVFLHKTRKSVSGMQQEIFTEEALWSFEDIIVDDDVSIEDELAGIDIRFELDGYKYAIDVKSSQESENGCEQGSDGDMYRAGFWTGLATYELGESFRANDDQLSIIRARIQSKFMAADQKAAL